MNQDPETTDVQPETGTVPPTTAGASTPSTQQGGENWEERFKGLQRIYQKKQGEEVELRAKIDTLQASSEESKQSETALMKQLEDLKKLSEQASAELDNLNKELETQKFIGQRTHLIMSEFPELARFEAEGLLPSADTEDDMRAKFAKFRDTIKASVDSGVQERMVGVAPAGGAGGGTTPTRTKVDVYAEITRLAGRRDPESRVKYDALIKEWDALNKQE